jgi:hypothetical protein
MAQYKETNMLCILLWCMLIVSSCSASEKYLESTWVGSTPGDDFVKSVLAIPAGTKVDFIRWNLILENSSSFRLDIIYGESKPNTLGFIGGGKKRSINGTVTISERGNFKIVYHLKSSELSDDILLAKFNENLIHFLSPQNQLLVGNGGWSYALNNLNPVQSKEYFFVSDISEENSNEVTFDGRTPCDEISKDHPEMKTSSSCFKLKWRLILRRDSVTHMPSTYTLRKILDGKRVDITGKWDIIKEEMRGIVIYRIEPYNKAESFSFLAVDNNILLFINRENNPYLGNRDFSGILNRK